MTEFKPELNELIPGLPDDVAYECLTRLHNSAHLAASGVCNRWRRLIRSSDFYVSRKRAGLTQSYACLIQAQPELGDGSKPVSPSGFGISIFESATRSWDRVDSVPAYPDRLPLFCQVASCEGKLVLMGGWDPDSYDPVTRIFVFDFVTRQWKQGKDMPSKRSFFAIGGLKGRVYVAGGHDPDKNALDSAWVYDILEDEWTELTRMSERRDECQGMIIGSEFWVISGYDTESQGQFNSSAEFYDVDSGQWTRVENAWVAGRSPRSCAGVGKKGELVNWAESSNKFRVGTCVVELGDRVLVCGSMSQGASHEFFMGKKKKNEEYGEFEELAYVPDQFLGFVQSGCCVEV